MKFKLTRDGSEHELSSAQVIEGAECSSFLLSRAESHGVLSTTLTRDHGQADWPDEVALTRTHAASAPDLSNKLPADRLRALAESRGIVWSDSMVGRDIAYWLSDERVNSYGDITLQSWDMNVYERSPVLALSHEWHGLSIGAGVEWGVIDRQESDYAGPALAFRALFAPNEISEDGDRVFRLANAGFFNGISPGFQALKIINVEDDKERAELGLGRYGVVLAHNQLLEASPTLIGANSGALKIQSLVTRAQSAGVSSDDFDFVREHERSRCKRSGEEDAWLNNDSAYLRLGRVLFPRTALTAKLIEDPIKLSSSATAEDDGSETSGGVTAAPTVTQTAAEDIMAAIQSVTGLVTDGFGQILSQLDDIGDAVTVPDEEPDDDEAEEQRRQDARDNARRTLQSGAAAIIEKLERMSPLGGAE